MTVKPNSNTANSEIKVESLISPVTFQVADYTGSTAGSNVSYVYGFKTEADINTYKFQGSPSFISQFNTRSILLFINGALQTPFVNYFFNGQFFYFASAVPDDAKIDIRCLAN